MIRYLIGVCIGWILGSAIVSAQTIQLQVSSTQTDVNTPLTATIIVQGGGAGEVSIAGIEGFEVVSQSRSQSVQIINGRQSTQIQLVLSLQPRSVGTYTLGPVSLDSDEGSATSESFLIEVSGEALFGSQSTLFEEDSVSNSNQKGTNTWLLWIFGVLIVGLIWRVWKVFRIHRTYRTEASYDTSNLQSSPSINHSVPSRPVNNILHQHLIDTARSDANADKSMSLGVLADKVSDGAMQGLLDRLEKHLYTGQIDPLLESDIQTYLDDRMS